MPAPQNAAPPESALARQADFLGDNKALATWLLIPTVAFVALQSGYWGLELPDEEAQTNYWALAGRTLIFVGILWASAGLLRTACKVSVIP